VQIAWRGQPLWDFDTTHVLVNYHGGIDKSDDWYYKWIAEAVPGQTPTSVADAALAAQQNPDIYHGNHAFQPQPYIDNTSHGLTLTADHDYGASTVKSISSVEDLDFVRTEDYGSIPVPNGWNRYSGHLAQYSEELRLSSNRVQRWNWIVGAFFGRDRLHEYDHFDETDNPIYNTYIFEERYLQTTTSAALFSHNEFSLTDAMRLTAGLRYTDEQKHFTGGTNTLPGDHSSNNIGLVNGTVCTPTCLVDTVLKYHEPTGKLGLDYRIGDAAFGLVGNEFRIFNIAKSRVSGLELESSWLPISGFQWDFGLGLLDTKVLASNVLAQAPSGVYGSIVGHRLGNAPKIELDSAMSYHWTFSEKLKATMILDINYRGDTFYYVQGDPRQHIGGYGLFNPSIALGGPADIWKLSVWAKNALNKLYFREIFNDGGSVIGFPAAPRQIGATFSYHWR
jgi:outer membrane receptor protein involved in Fe transport